MIATDTPTTCPMNALLNVLTGPWTTYILWILHSQGPQRFGQLQRDISGISSKMLAERLRKLTAAGLVHREQAQTIPPQVTYSLTERGHELRSTLNGLHDLALRWRADGWAATGDEGK